jgi:DNA-binding transcriptional regulator YdaS (Cro superfamily)
VICIKLNAWLDGGYGRHSFLARNLNVGNGFITKIKRGARPVPARLAARIERLTNAAVTRADLRPHDWQDIWPELAHSQQQGGGKEMSHV